MKKHITHCEDGKFYGLVKIENGHEYYIGPFNSRSTARRAVLKNDYRKASGYKKETK